MNKSPPPPEIAEPSQFHRTNQAAVCPSCERFIGPADVCPYCGCDSVRSSTYRRLRRLALGLAFAGVVLLFLMARASEVARVRIGAITPQMNLALVRVEGVVERDAYVSPRGGVPTYLSFALSDGTGQLRVTAYGKVAAELFENNLVPRKGWRVGAVGTLNVTETENIKLRLRRATDLQREPAGDIPLSQTGTAGKL